MVSIDHKLTFERSYVATIDNKLTFERSCGNNRNSILKEVMWYQ